MNNQRITFSRRKLATAIRKAIISYYTEKEKYEIAQAAKKRGLSISRYVASAVLEQVKRDNRNR